MTPRETPDLNTPTRPSKPKLLIIEESEPFKESSRGLTINVARLSNEEILAMISEWLDKEA